MLELMLDRHVIYVLMGMSAFAGVVSKVVVGRTLRKLVAAAESMGKSNHPLMRLVRAKFEHTCMISEKVENVGGYWDSFLDMLDKAVTEGFLSPEVRNALIVEDNPEVLLGRMEKEETSLPDKLK